MCYVTTTFQLVCTIECISIVIKFVGSFIEVWDFILANQAHALARISKERFGSVSCLVMFSENGVDNPDYLPLRRNHVVLIHYKSPSMFVVRGSSNIQTCIIKGSIFETAAV